MSKLRTPEVSGSKRRDGSRREITCGAVTQAIANVEVRTATILERHGSGAFAGHHEILGVLTEEYYEVVYAVHNKERGSLQDELLDLAAACVKALASLQGPFK